MFCCFTVFALAAVADEPLGQAYKTKLLSVIQKYKPKANVEEEGNRLVYRFHTQTFKIHTIHKTGHISEKAHDEEGPDVDGILVSLSLHKGQYSGAAEIPQVINRPYWKTFINAYPVAGGQYLWLSVSYGSKTDMKLIEDLKTCFGPLLPQQPATKNPVIKKAAPTDAHDKK